MTKQKNNIEIIDKRTTKEFSGISFSKYKKTEVVKQIVKSVNSGKIEDALYWSAELICAGHFLDLWETIYKIMSVNIYVANPKLPIYIETKMNRFKDIIVSHLNNELILRNITDIRQIFAEVIAILTFSKKKHKYDYIKIEQNDFIMTEMTHRLKADSLDYANIVFKRNDPKELFIPINELCYNLIKTRNSMTILYWIEWVINYEALCKKKKEKIICHKRENIYSKEPTDIIWLLWDTILRISNKQNLVIYKIIYSILNLFKLHYSSGVKKRRRYLIYYAVYLITEDYNLNTNICDNKELVKKISISTDTIYKLIKKSEIPPDNIKNYLFVGLDG